VNDDAAPQAAGWASPVDRLWRLFAWPRLTVILLVWVAVVLALSAIIPQPPPNIEDPLVRSQWLASVPSSVRPTVERLYAFGLFDLLDSVWLRLPLVFLLSHALVMLASRGPSIWRRVWQSPVKVSRLGKSFDLDRAWPEPAEEVQRQTTSRLGKAGYHILFPPDENNSKREQESIVAQRWRWSWLGLAGIYLGLGLLSAGLILESWLGQVQELHLEPDEPTALPVSAVNVPSFVLEEVDARGDNPLGPVRPLALVRVVTGVGESKSWGLRLHSGQLLHGRWITLADVRPRMEVTAVDEESGENVLLQPFFPRVPAQERARLPLNGDPESQLVGVPSENVTLHVAIQENAAGQAGPGLPERDEAQGEEGHPEPTFFLSFFRGAEPLPSQSEYVHSGQEVTFEGVRYLVTFSYDATLRIRSSLWWIVIGAGWGLTALSFIALTVMPPVHVQGDVEPVGKGSRIALTVDVLGDEQRSQGELRALITPDV
jgi:hypothetical protein